MYFMYYVYNISTLHIFYWENVFTRYRERNNLMTKISAASAKTGMRKKRMAQRFALQPKCPKAIQKMLDYITKTG
jgi:hypothetical protein